MSDKAGVNQQSSPAAKIALFRSLFLRSLFRGPRRCLSAPLFVAKNSFVPGLGGVWIFSPEGKHLGTIRTPEGPTNLAFGGADGRTLYITAKTKAARIRLEAPGRKLKG